MSNDDFPAFLARVRSGDERVVADLVKRFGAVIQREVRIRLTDPSAYRTLDDDVCQSVLVSFCVRASLGQYDLNDPAQPRQLLVSVARNKLAHAARRQHALKRGGGRAPPEADDNLAGDAAAVSRSAAGRELLEMVRQRLSDDEGQIADLRGHGHEWAEIAHRLGGTPDGRRMQLTRALDRVGRALGLEDGDD